MEKEAKERDPILRVAWFRKLWKWHAKQLVFLDESGINTKLGRPKYSYTPKGKKIRMPVRSGKAENISLLPAFTIDGYIACNVYKGGVKKDNYLAFLEHDVLPKCSPYPGDRSIIVIDNCRIHHGPLHSNLLLELIHQEIKELVEVKFSCKLKYLPPYSPDYNPIEFSFSVIKKALKGAYRVDEDTSAEEMAGWVIEVANQIVTKELAINQFRHCHINTTGLE